MQTVEVTDEQYAVIQRLRAAISEDVVGRYGFVRERDAIQFLIDNLETGEDGEDALDVDFEADTSGRTATDDVAAAVESAIESGSQADGSDEAAEVSYDEEAETSAADDEGDGDADADSAESESDGDADADTSTGDSSDDAGDDETTDDTDAGEGDGESVDDDDDEDDTEDEGTSENEDETDGDADGEDDDDADDENEDEEAGNSSGAADDDDMLNKMMNLLETHDDKWDESPAADYRYRVTLPDDSTEDVQTKDDVRALLFKNY